MDFVWDEHKNHINIRKHGIDFADVYRVFDGPMIVQLDDRDTIRLISARKALTHERRRFEQELQNRLG